MGPDVDRDRESRREAIGSTSIMAFTGLGLSLLVPVAGVYTVLCVGPPQGDIGDVGVAGLITFGVPLLIGLLLLAIAINLSIVRSRVGEMTGRVCGIVGVVGLCLNAVSIAVPLAIILSK
jgi:hypothetical protein